MLLFVCLLFMLVTAPGRATPGCGPDIACADDVALAATTSSSATLAAEAPTRLSPDAFSAQGLRPEVLELALKAYETARARGDTQKQIITVIDYSLPSSQKRLWVIDLSSGQLLFHEYVAHGSGSGGDDATRFSNTPNSRQSNIGLMKTAETYHGKHGYSLKLDGLESGWNSNARSRAIVMHAADHVSAAFISSQGRLGRSWGCPALNPAVSRKIIDTIKGGSLVFGYYPDNGWLGGSKYLN